MFIADSFRKETTPSLVYILLKLVSERNCTMDEVVKLLSGYDADSASTINKVYSFAEACQLVKKNSRGIVCLVDKKHLKSYSDFAYALSCEAFKVSNNFTKLTQWFLAQDLSMTGYKADRLLEEYVKVGAVKTKDEIYGWQDWLVAFGLATYVTKPSDNIIFDCHVRIKRFLENESKFKKGATIEARPFMTELVVACPEFSSAVNLKANTVCESVSMSLRILHNLGTIEIFYKRDSADNWHFTNAQHAIKNDFTNIKVV